MTDQFSRDHYRDSRQPGENSSRRRVDANPNHRTAGNNARHASSSRRPAGTRQQTSTHQQGAPRPRSASQAGREPAPHRTPSQNPRQQMRQGAPSRNHASSSANRPSAQGNVRPASYNRSRAQANRNNPANAAVYNDYSRYTERRSEAPRSCCHRRYSGAHHRHRHWRVLRFKSAHFRHHRQRSEAHRFQR